MKRALGILTLGVLSLAATPTPFGGWAVVTLDDIPEYLVVNEPTTITFKIRQHGRTLLNDRSPSVTIKDADSGLLSRIFGHKSVAATRESDDGTYRATITPTDTGEVILVVNTDVFRWKTELLPLPVRESHEDVHPLSREDRGRQLFAAKGCATCHAKRDDPAFVGWQVVRVGPDLTERSYPAEWLTAKIAAPGQFATASSIDRMPDLGVGDAQLVALVSYINQRHTTTDTAAEGSPTKP